VPHNANVSAPRCKHRWLEPTAELGSVRRVLLETVSASGFRLSGHFAAAMCAGQPLLQGAYVKWPRSAASTEL